MNGARVLIYSHDSFGLGHLRRCREIAHGLVGTFPDMSVLILSGSPIIGSFDFRTRTDFVRVPGVIKLRNGDYTSLKLKMDVDHILKLRGAIIERTAEVFEPDVFIVDKEPLGLRGEVARTLKRLKRRGTRLVLGLRDVMDEPAQLAPEWKRKRVLPALRAFTPDLLLISAGFDGGCNDVGNSKLDSNEKYHQGLDLKPEDFEWATAELLRVAAVCCPGRVVSLLEGGYGAYEFSKTSATGWTISRAQLGENAAAHASALVGVSRVHH